MGESEDERLSAAVSILPCEDPVAAPGVAAHLLASDPASVWASMSRACDANVQGVWKASQSLARDSRYRGGPVPMILLGKLLLVSARSRYGNVLTLNRVPTEVTEIIDYLIAAGVRYGADTRAFVEGLPRVAAGIAGDDIIQAWAAEDLLDALDADWPSGEAAHHVVPEAIDGVSARVRAWQASVGFLNRVAPDWRSHSAVSAALAQTKIGLERRLSTVRKRWEAHQPCVDVVRRISVDSCRLSLLDPGWQVASQLEDLRTWLAKQVASYRMHRLHNQGTNLIPTIEYLATLFAIDRNFPGTPEGTAAVTWLASATSAYGWTSLESRAERAKSVLHQLEVYSRPYRFTSPEARALWATVSELPCVASATRAPHAEQVYAPVQRESPGWG